MGLFSKLIQTITGNSSSPDQWDGTYKPTPSPKATAAPTQKSAPSKNRNGLEPDTGDNADCQGRSKIVEERIETALANLYPDYHFKKNLPIDNYIANLPKAQRKKNVDYIITDSFDREIAAIMIIKTGVYKTQWLKDLYASFSQQGLKHVHFMLQLPNRMVYIEKKLKELLG